MTQKTMDRKATTKVKRFRGKRGQRQAKREVNKEILANEHREASHGQPRVSGKRLKTIKRIYIEGD